MQRVNGNSSMSPVTRGLKQRSGFFSFGEIFVFTDVLHGTYIATPGVPSPGYRGLNPGISGLAHHTDRYISSLLLAAAIAAPTAIMADPRPQGAGVRF